MTPLSVSSWAICSRLLGLLALRIVRRLPACAQLSDPAELMGRCWTILEGGNRGNVLVRSAVAMCYGD
jgi:hypothetical protein